MGDEVEIRSWLKSFEYQARILSPEPKTVREHYGDFLVSGLIGYIVEIANWIWVFIVNGWVDKVVQNGLYAHHSLHATGTAESMPNHRLRRTYRDLVCKLAEDPFYSHGFGGVVQGS